MLVCWASLTIAAAAQAPGPGSSAAPTTGGDTDPIACWWKTDTQAVRVGEPFTLTLTCGVVDTPQVRGVVDAQRLDSSAVELTPFEVVGVTRHRDVEAPPRRYFQYSYTLRLLGDEFFGQDVDIPSLPITYTIESSGTTGTRGRDQVYLLPSLAVRVLSLVPRTATDIQDAVPDTFGDIDRRTFRSLGEFVAAGVLFAFAAVLAGVAVVRAVGPHAARAVAEPRALSPAEVLRGCLREAMRAKSEAERSGWTLEIIDRSLAISRIAGAVALARPVAQSVVDGSVAAKEGQLAIRKGVLSTERVLISGSATAVTVAAAGTARNGSRTDARILLTLEELSESLLVLASARYGRGGDLDASALDAALETTTRALGRLYAMQQWRARATDRLLRASARLRGLWDR